MEKFWRQDIYCLNTWRLLSAVLCVILFVVSPVTVDGKPPTYEDDVLPVFVRSAAVVTTPTGRPVDLISQATSK